MKESFGLSNYIYLVLDFICLINKEYFIEVDSDWVLIILNYKFIDKIKVFKNDVL